MKKYEFLEHPADIKVRAFGKDLAELFVNSALGMMEFLYGDIATLKQKAAKAAAPTPIEYETIEVTADDLESLLVSWLAEILFLSDTKHRAYIEYKIQEINQQKMIVEVGSCAAKAKDDIKAVTYHDLEITKTDTGLVAIVVYDI